MAEASAATSGKIFLNFEWEGPSVWRGGISHGGLEIKVADLIFNPTNSQTSEKRYNVHLPDRFHPETPAKICITPYRASNALNIDSLHVTIARVRSLVLNLGVFERGPSYGPSVLHPDGTVTRGETVRRSDRRVEIKLPKDIDQEGVYTLRVTSNDFNFRAELIKNEVGATQQEEASAEGVLDAQLAADRKELSEILNRVLTGLLGMKLLEFSMSIMTMPSANMLNVNSAYKPLTAAKSCIDSEIEKIDPAGLRGLVSKIPTHQTPELQRVLIKQFLLLMGRESVTNICRQNIQTGVTGDLSPQVKVKIEDICKKFTEIVFKQVV